MDFPRGVETHLSVHSLSTTKTLSSASWSVWIRSLPGMDVYVAKSFVPDLPTRISRSFVMTLVTSAHGRARRSSARVGAGPAFLLALRAAPRTMWSHRRGGASDRKSTRLNSSHL